MTTDSETTEQYLTFVRSKFLICVLVIGITADKNQKPAITIPFARWRRHSGELTVNPIVVVVVVVVI